jgi:pimeloyl-ACP methyl ester carboxylesterase
LKRVSRGLRSAVLVASAGAALLLAAGPSAAADRPAFLKPCRLPGVEHEALCGSVRRPLDPGSPAGTQIDVHVAVLPALARRRLPDPVFVFAGGPGQSAIDLAGPMARLLSRTLNRRDVVLVDQRGTGRSAPLHCAAPAPGAPLAEVLEPQRQAERLQRCREALQRLPHGDLRQFTTSIAVQDVEAVRQALGVGPVNLLAASYGTRAALEFMRQFPGSVRRAVLDGVAPPDMALPASASADSQAALDAVLAQCEADPGCRARHPALGARWRDWLATLPREVSLAHPATGRPETLRLSREAVLSLARMPLYAPALTAALPDALAEALEGHVAPLAALASSLGGTSPRRGVPALAEGMHFSVVCSEDMPLLEAASEAASPPVGADFGDAPAGVYRRACADWPRGIVPQGFRTVGAARAPVLLLSGGRDPATPPRHAARVAEALGPQARHVVAPNAGHGLLAIPCTRDLLQRFLDDSGESPQASLDAACLQAVPAPRPFLAPRAVEAR